MCIKACTTPGAFGGRDHQRRDGGPGASTCPGTAQTACATRSRDCHAAPREVRRSRAEGVVEACADHKTAPISLRALLESRAALAGQADRWRA